MIAASHLVPLEGTTWSMWRDVALRNAGFPADMLLAVCDEALARSADLGSQPDGPQRYCQVAGAIASQARPDHNPRITTDRQKRYYQARRWPEKFGLLERVFFRAPIEGKPMAVDRP